jgi:hypothetical protein
MFPDPIKIQIDFRKGIAHLGLRVSDNYVQNLVMPLHRVTKIFTPSTMKYEWIVDEMYCQFLRKKDYIKLFYKLEYIDHHFRFTHEDWEAAGQKLLQTIKDNPSKIIVSD